MIIRRSIFLCRECRREYARSTSPLQPGSGLRRCPHCTTVFRDGSREWPELKTAEKFALLFPTTVLGYMGGVIVTLAVVIPQMTDRGERSLILGVVTLIYAAALGAVFLQETECS